MANTLEVSATDLILDGVLLKGSVDFLGQGTLTIRNSIIEGGWGSPFVVLGRTTGATIDVRDCTLRWRAGTSPDPGSGIGAIQIAASVKIIALRNDISGAPDGIQTAGDDTLIQQNWIHDLGLTGAYPNNSHNEAVFVHQGARVQVLDNRFEVGWDGTHQTAALFFQPGQGDSITRPTVSGNFLSGGGYTLRFEGSTSTAVVKGNVFEQLPHQFGDVSVTEGATVSEWSDNRHVDGSAVPPP
jgi:hypothetical protein